MVLVRVMDGVIKKGMKVQLMKSKREYQIEQVGILDPKPKIVESLSVGEVGFITAAIKSVSDAWIGDTITDLKKPALEALPGFKESIPVVFCGLYPADAGDFDKLRVFLSKLRLNDTFFHFEIESSAALGLGFRCGFDEFSNYLCFKISKRYNYLSPVYSSFYITDKHRFTNNIIKELYKRNHGYRKISYIFNSKNIKTFEGKFWGSNSVHSVIKRDLQRQVRMKLRYKQYPLNRSKMTIEYS